jgi:P-type Ca2+ transporter type 2C
VHGTRIIYPPQALLKVDMIASRPVSTGLEVWHTLPTDEVASRVRTEPERGLSRAEAVRRLEAHGPNVLVETRGRSALAILVGQFKSLIVALLFAATAVALALGDSIEAVAILVVIVLNALIGFLTEWKAEAALTALSHRTPTR